MLSGLSADELKKLLLSVGTHRGERPLSPVEAAVLFQKARSAGASLSACAEAVQLEGPTWIGRFMKLLDLPEDLHHLVDWGRRNGSIAFTSASEVARLSDPVDQRRAVEAALAHDLNSSEVRQLVQLKVRSRKSIQECVAAVLKMRPQIQVKHVFIGAIQNASLRARLQGLSQHDRDAKLKAVCDREWPTVHVTGHVGSERFTLVGDKSFGELVSSDKESIERRINGGLEQCLVQ